MNASRLIILDGLIGDVVKDATVQDVSWLLQWATVLAVHIVRKKMVDDVVRTSGSAPSEEDVEKKIDTVGQEIAKALMWCRDINACTFHGQDELISMGMCVVASAANACADIMDEREKVAEAVLDAIPARRSEP